MLVGRQTVKAGYVVVRVMLEIYMFKVSVSNLGPFTGYYDRDFRGFLHSVHTNVGILLSNTPRSLSPNRHLLTHRDYII
jgi:hypothetical protein